MSILRRIISILWGVALGAVILAPATTSVLAGHLDSALEAKAGRGSAPEMVGVILQTNGPPSASHAAVVRAFGGNPGDPFSTVEGFPATVPSPALKGLANNPHFTGVSFDAPMQAFWDTNAAGDIVGAPQARATYGVNGRGIGVAVVDSGIIYNHTDLKNSGGSLYNAAVSFNDFVSPFNKSMIDPYGHGTHVSGLIAGNGSLVSQFAGGAPAASLHILRVLDGYGRGSVSKVLAALDWVKSTQQMFNIRVVNLSLGHPVYESYLSDPLCRAVEDLVKRGVVVVAAAGNYGRTSDGQTVYGGIVSPANSPYALTVGAMNPRNTLSRGDDVIAGFSSRGPTAIDNGVKPDVVAPGAFVVSLYAQNSYFALNYGDLKIETSLYGLGMGADDYYTLSGTSMAAPVVSGIVALMLHKNPSLTPNLVKGILQYTSENRGYDVMTQGAGYVNAVGALEAASKITSDPGSYSDGDYWLSSPLSGQSLVNGEAVTWTGAIYTSQAIFWGGALDYNFTSLWSQGVIWNWNLLEALNDSDFLDSGVQASAVIWNPDFSLLQASSVLWDFLFSGLSSDDVVYGEGYVWEGGKKP